MRNEVRDTNKSAERRGSHTAPARGEYHHTHRDRSGTEDSDTTIPTKPTREEVHERGCDLGSRQARHAACAPNCRCRGAEAPVCVLARRPFLWGHVGQPHADALVSRGHTRAARRRHLHMQLAHRHGSGPLSRGVVAPRQRHGGRHQPARYHPHDAGGHHPPSTAASSDCRKHQHQAHCCAWRCAPIRAAAVIAACAGASLLPAALMLPLVLLPQATLAHPPPHWPPP